MNRFVPSRFAETVRELAIGIEPIDAALRLRVPRPLEVEFDSAPFRLPRPPIDHHRSGLHVLLYQPRLRAPVGLRFQDPARRYVPRRLRFPLNPEAVALTSPAAHRVRRPALFPGAAYDVADATGLRGRVLRGGAPMRWARVEARLAGGGDLVGRAHGDDRGEFLLLVGSEAAPPGDMPATIALEVTVFGPGLPPVPTSADVARLDPLWDLPIEAAAAPGAADPVSDGVTRPASYTASVTRAVTLAPGRIGSGEIFTVA
jgi:hypothetical protein